MEKVSSLQDFRESRATELERARALIAALVAKNETLSRENIELKKENAELNSLYVQSQGFMEYCRELAANAPDTREFRRAVEENAELKKKIAVLSSGLVAVK